MFRSQFRILLSVVQKRFKLNKNSIYHTDMKFAADAKAIVSSYIIRGPRAFPKEKK